METPCSPSCIETPCDCGEWLHIRRAHNPEDGYTMRHGDNPEHQRFFEGTSLFIWGSREWRAAVHERMR